MPTEPDPIRIPVWYAAAHEDDGGQRYVTITAHRSEEPEDRTLSIPVRRILSEDYAQ